MSLNILYGNINSYNTKKQILYNYIENNNINCVMLVETKTKCSNMDTRYRNWKTLQLNGNLITNYARGGSMIQTHPNLNMGKANPPKINNLLNECLHITIPFQNDHLHIFLVYIHPTSKIEENVFVKASLYKYAIIIGDLNVNKTKNKQIYNFTNNTNFEKWITPPTFLMENNNDTTPDIILYSQNLKNNFQSVVLTPDLGSDHLAMHIQFKLDSPPTIFQPITKFDFKKSNVEKINCEVMAFIETKQNEVNNIDDVNQFNRTLKQIIHANTPKIETQYYSHTLPPFIIKMIKAKRKMLREYQVNGDPEIKKQINQFNKSIHKMIFQYKTHTWLQTCKTINESRGRLFYQQVNRLSKYKTKPNLPAIEVNGQLYESDTDKANIFATYYEDHFTEHIHPNFNQDHQHVIENWYQEYFNSNAINDDVEIDEEEYFSILHNQKNTSPGIDNIPWTIIKQLEYAIHEYIIKIFTYCLKNNQIPIEWKKGMIINIPKTNSDNKKPSGYRPITLLPALGKLLEKIVRNRVNNIINLNIPTHQFGFREKCATIHPLIVLSSNVQTARHQNLKSAAVFLDITKAFDSVWHKGLLYKMKKIGTPDHLVHFTRQFLENRQICVKLNEEISDSFTPTQGLPQGSPLSPLLYNIYSYDIAQHQNTSQDETYILQYADDTAIISHHKSMNKVIENLQAKINATEEWFNKWRLVPNPAKTQFTIFNHSVSNTSPTINVGNQQINPAQSSKYLGVTLDHKLNFNMHTASMKTKIKNRAKHFRSLTFKKEGISTKTASIIYKSICRPIIEYANILFMTCRKPALQNIKVAETSTLRSITRMRHPDNPLYNPSNELLYTRTHIKPIDIRYQDLLTKFISRPHNINLIQSHCRVRDRQMRSKHKFPELTLYEEIQATVGEDWQ